MFTRKNSKIMHVSLMVVLGVVTSINQQVKASESTLSVLQMMPQLTEAFEEYVVHKNAQREKRRLLADADDDDFSDIGDVDDEEIIDPTKELPDTWDTTDEQGEIINPIENEYSECVSVLMDLTNNFMSYNNTVMHIFRNSGKDYNDFGRYEDCNKIHHFNYYMITVLKKFPIPFTMGLCLPQECDLTDLEDFKPFMTKAINGALPNMFEDVKGFSTAPSIEESDVQFVDPAVENKKTVKWGVMSVLSCGLMAFFTVMSVIASIKLWSKHRDTLRRDSETDSQPGQSSRGSFRGNSANSASMTGESSSDRTGCDKFMRAFSLIDNVGKLSKPRAKQGDQELEVMNGLRVISCVLIILGNSYYYTLRSPIQNLEVV